MDKGNIRGKGYRSPMWGACGGEMHLPPREMTRRQIALTPATYQNGPESCQRC